MNATSTIGAFNRIAENVGAASHSNAWYDSTGVVGIVGTIVGVILSTLLTVIIDNVRERKKARRLANGFFVEIVTNRALANRTIAEMKKLLATFSQIPELPRPAGGPSVTHLEIDHNEFYRANINNLGILDEETCVLIKIFYLYSRGWLSQSKKAAEQFTLYYAASKMVAKVDVIGRLEKLIEQMEIMNVAGAEALAMLVARYHQGGDLGNPMLIADKIDEVVARIEALKCGDIVNSEEWAGVYELDLVILSKALLNNKSLKHLQYGKYEKVGDQRD